MAKAGPGVQAGQGMGGMVLGGVADGEGAVAPQRSRVPAKGEGDCETWVHRWIGTARCNPVTVGLIGDLWPAGREVVLAVGVLHVCQECAPGGRPRHTAPP